MFPYSIIVSAKSNVISFYDDKGNTWRMIFVLENGFLIPMKKIKKIIFVFNGRQDNID